MTQTHTLSIDGHQIVALEYNQDIDSPPLIFIHGILNSVYLWEPVQIQTVQEQFHWFSLSLPGHHPAKLPSDFKATDLTPDLLGRVLAQAIKKLTGGKPALVVGYSTGAYAALCVAHHAPHLIDRLLLLEGFANGVWGRGMRIDTLSGQLSGVVHALLHPYGIVNSPGMSFTWFGYDILASDLKRMNAHPKVDAVVRSNWETMRDGDLMQIYPYFRKLFHQDITHWLPGIKIPVLILHGDEDHTIIPAHAYHMHRYLPDNELRWIAGSGHLPFLERPQMYEDHVKRWLQQS